jgi:hypothetical protein
LRSTWLAGVLCALVFAVATVETIRLSSRALDAWRVRVPTIGLNLVVLLFPELEKLAAAKEDPADWRIAFLGDSISISMREGARRVPAAIRRNLVARDERFELRSLAGLGATPFDYYFLADMIAAAGPDQVVLAFSLQSLGHSFDQGRDRLSGWVAPRRVPSVALAPIHAIGLTIDDLLMNVAIVNARAGEMWRQLLIAQARMGVARKALADELGTRIGGDGPQNFAFARHMAQSKRSRIRGGTRYAASRERTHYGAALTGLPADHPVLSVLADTLRAFADAGIETLVYVNPINVEHLSALGLLEGSGLSDSLATLEAVVRGAGGDYVDLHDLLPDAAFRDAAGHLGTAEWVDAPERIAAAVAPHIVARAGRVRTGSR